MGLMAKRGPKEISAEHKAAMATGRAEGRAIKSYLEALENNKPRRGRRRTPESIATRLEKIEAEIADADPVKRLHLVQERRDLSDELAAMEEPVDMTALEEQFVIAAKGYSDRKGISYAAWREVGVPASVLERSGISRSA
jgi:uncharacterized protein YicC (UPF0701 family)